MSHARVKRTELARALSKLGFCSRGAASELIQAGRVRLNGKVQRDPEQRVILERDRIEIDGVVIRAAVESTYIMLNKPRGLVTTTSDERGRDTVFRCLEGADLPRVLPVGRLDKASEGLLLFTNDTLWADHITNPESHLPKTYHVQVNCVADETLTQRLERGVQESEDWLQAKRASPLRAGTTNSWVEIVLEEGKNRHIRRMLAVLGVEVFRLLRVAIGPLELGPLAKGKFRKLTAEEVQQLGGHQRTP